MTNRNEGLLLTNESEGISTIPIQIGLPELPYEVWKLIFSLVSPNIIFEKLLRGFQHVPSLNRLQLIAFEHTFSKSIVMKCSKSSPSFFYKASSSTMFTIDTYKSAYEIIKFLIKYNLEVLRQSPVHRKFIFPSKILLTYHITEANTLKIQEYFVRTIELLNINRFYKDLIPSISFQLTYKPIAEFCIPELKALNSKIFQKVFSLDYKLDRISVINSSVFESHISFNRHLFENLTELYLYNLNIDDYSTDIFSISRSRIRLLDFSSNKLTSLKFLTLPVSIEQLFVRANNLKTLSEMDFHRLVNLRTIDVAINLITDVSNCILPPNLRVLKLNYNEVKHLADFTLVDGMETLDLSNNYITNIDEVQFPSTLRELQLNNNRLASIRPGLLSCLKSLRSLNLSDNRIDDLEELGQLPNSLVELNLNNNEIDHQDELATILTPKLKTLSMVSTGLMTLNNICFPQYLVELNLAKNEIVELSNLKFCSNFKSLNLSDNKLSCFSSDGIPDGLTYLNLSKNRFHGLQNVVFPARLICLILDDNPIGELSDQILAKLPESLVELSMSNTSLTSRNTNHLVQFALCLPKLQRLSLNDNLLTNINHFVYPSTLRRLSLENNRLTNVDFSNFPVGIDMLKLEERNLSVLHQFDHAGH